MTDKLPSADERILANLCRILAGEQAARWGYTETLDQEQLAAYIQERSEDFNLRADVETVWRYSRQVNNDW